jgi:hypothetical protein
MAPPKGCKKTGGRVKGTANRLTTDYKQLIGDSNPIEFLLNAFQKGYIEGAVHPSMLEDSEKYLTLTYKERCDIARDLAKKIVPDLKAIDHGEFSGKMTFIMQSAIQHAPNSKPRVTNEGKNSNKIIEYTE